MPAAGTGHRPVAHHRPIPYQDTTGNNTHQPGACRTTHPDGRRMRGSRALVDPPDLYAPKCWTGVARHSTQVCSGRWGCGVARWLVGGLVS